MDELLWMNFPCGEPEEPAAGHILNAEIICLDEMKVIYTGNFEFGGHLMVTTFKAV